MCRSSVKKFNMSAFAAYQHRMSSMRKCYRRSLIQAMDITNTRDDLGGGKVIDGQPSSCVRDQDLLLVRREAESRACHSRVGKHSVREIGFNLHWSVNSNTGEHIFCLSVNDSNEGETQVTGKDEN